MKSNGIIIPGAKLDMSDDIRGEEIDFFASLIRREDAERIVFNRLNTLHAHMLQRGLHTLVVSAENLINPNNFQNLFVNAQDLFDIQIVAYVRRQDDYFASAWQQWHLKVYPSLQAYVDARLGKDANWAQMLAPWEERFGRDRITVRAFQRSALINGDILDDFFSITGLKRKGCVRRAKLSNVSFDEHLGTLAHRVRDLFSSTHDNKFYDDMRFVIGPQMMKSYRGSILFTLEERQRILSAYDKCNRILREKYFPDLSPDMPLFEAPSEMDVVKVNELEQLRCQQDLLVRAIAGLIERVRALENSK